MAVLRQQLEDRCHEASALQAQYDLQQEDMNELMAMNEELVTRNTALEAEKTQAQVCSFHLLKLLIQRVPTDTGKPGK